MVNPSHGGTIYITLNTLSFVALRWVKRKASHLSVPSSWWLWAFHILCPNLQICIKLLLPSNNWGKYKDAQHCETFMDPSRLSMSGEIFVNLAAFKPFSFFSTDALRRVKMYLWWVINAKSVYYSHISPVISSLVSTIAYILRWIGTTEWSASCSLLFWHFFLTLELKHNVSQLKY